MVAPLKVTPPVSGGLLKKGGEIKTCVPLVSPLISCSNMTQGELFKPQFNGIANLELAIDDNELQRAD